MATGNMSGRASKFFEATSSWTSMTAYEQISFYSIVRRSFIVTKMLITFEFT